MQAAIQNMLDQLEQEHQIRIIYAVESGSRAWGFASPDSDYDVRYIYIRPQEEYLRVNQQKDTIEGPLDDVMDFSGWDVKKALALLGRTNPSLMEWANSPIIYRTTPEWELLAQQIPTFFNPVSNMHHYMSMALQNWHKHLQDEQVKIKRYLYVLRPVLCCRWLEAYRTVPPVLFTQLCESVLPVALKPVVDNLLERKKYADEAELIDHIPALDDFLSSEIQRLHGVLHGMENRLIIDYDRLNDIFRTLLKQPFTPGAEKD